MPNAFPAQPHACKTPRTKLHSSLVEADKKKKTRPTSEDLTSVRDLEDKLNREKERNEELSRQLKEEREKLDKPLPNKRRFGSNEDDLKRYEERISTLKEQLSQEKERNDELKTKLGEGSRASSDELRTSKTENSRLQRESPYKQDNSKIRTLNIEENAYHSGKEIADHILWEHALLCSSVNIVTCSYFHSCSCITYGLFSFLLHSFFLTPWQCRASLGPHFGLFLVVWCFQHALPAAQLEEERSKGTVAEERQKELTVSWLKERDDLKKDLAEAKRAKEKFEREVRTYKRERDSMVRRRMRDRRGSGRPLRAVVQAEWTVRGRGSVLLVLSVLEE
ncbi:hypothetical protein E2C01_008190 [Portunus trituberculatus]|uniref:Uncharacterized protein n=1 Tax=Portunus trituberculatus TaxID=210409 RepID=A0A5B7D163_PORTR|nr:hypothetical protein [Portunus trituberculatus]